MQYVRDIIETKSVIFIYTKLVFKLTKTVQMCLTYLIRIYVFFLRAHVFLFILFNCKSQNDIRTIVIKQCSKCV